jgi:hypothetical protein
MVATPPITLVVGQIRARTQASALKKASKILFTSTATIRILPLTPTSSKTAIPSI